MRAGKMKRKLNHDATMDGIMRQTPAAVRVVLQHGMLCVGCPIASFHTISDAARSITWTRNSFAAIWRRPSRPAGAPSPLPSGLGR
ncbi:DUF1858 domain-containing protein [Mesorhizobium atlanticum]